MGGVIDLRSDTATRPTPGMRQAMASAEVGDEQRREDPTVNELERRAAELGGPAVFAGLMTRPLATSNGRFTPAQVRAAYRRSDGFHVPQTRLVSVENTHNGAGGPIRPPAEIAPVVARRP